MVFCYNSPRRLRHFLYFTAYRRYSKFFIKQMIPSTPNNYFLITWATDDWIATISRPSWPSLRPGLLFLPWLALMTLSFPQAHFCIFEILCTFPCQVQIQPTPQFSVAFYSQTKIFPLQYLYIGFTHHRTSTNVC